MAVFSVCAFVGCTTVKTTSEYSGGPLPRSDRIFVYDLDVSPGEVRLDRGLSARVTQAAKGTSRSEQEIATGRKVASALSDHLVKEIRKLGLDAERASGDPPTSATRSRSTGNPL